MWIVVNEAGLIIIKKKLESDETISKHIEESLNVQL
jgi:hypothetical protein